MLSVAGKILTKILQSRIMKTVTDKTISESQCGFRSARGTADTIFVVRQLQEKCIEQRMNLFAVFIDLTKAFDTVNRSALWCVLRKRGIPPKITNIIISLHEGMLGTVKIDGERTESFEMTTGVKQRCVIAPTLFILYLDAISNCTKGIYIRFRTDGSLFNLARLRAQTKTSMNLVQELLYADGCGIFAHSEDDLQLLMNNFVRAFKSFGLTISIQKTEVLYQPVPGTIYFEPQNTVEDAALKVTNVFTYLGSKIANDGQQDIEINCRIAKASASVGKLHSRVWSSHDLKLNTKVEVYNAVVLSMLLRRGLFTSDTSRSSRPSTNNACMPYVASNGKTWSQILKYFRDAKLSRLKPTSAIIT